MASRPWQIGFSIKSLALTVLGLVCIVSGLDWYRNQTMVDKWIKVTGRVYSIRHDSVLDERSVRHQYITVYTFYNDKERTYSNSLIISDDKIPAALKRYPVSGPVVLLCNPADMQQSVVEQERDIPARSAMEKQFLIAALGVMIVLWFIPNRFFDLGLNEKLAGDHYLRKT